MNRAIRRRPSRDRGMVLITSLLLLLVVTILALAMFRGVGLENRIAGNVMDKQRALEAATSTEDYAEQWLINNVSTTSPVTCSSSTFGGTSAPTICANTLAQATGATALSVPWGGSDPVGYSYNPTTTGNNTLFTVSTTGGADDYYQAPTVYVTYLGGDATTPNAFDYQVDAWSYGGSTGTVAVVESVYQVRYSACGPPQCGL